MTTGAQLVICRCVLEGPLPPAWLVFSADRMTGVWLMPGGSLGHQKGVSFMVPLKRGAKCSLCSSPLLRHWSPSSLGTWYLMRGDLPLQGRCSYKFLTFGAQ